MGQYAHLVRTYPLCFHHPDLLTNAGIKLVDAQVSNSEGEENPSDPYILPSRHPPRDADTHRGHSIRRPSCPDEVQEEADYRRS